MPKKLSGTESQADRRIETSQGRDQGQIETKTRTKKLRGFSLFYSEIEPSDFDSSTPHAGNFGGEDK